MAYRKVDESNLSSLADKIRSKGGTSGGMVFPAGFLSSVDELPDKPVIQSLEITENGTYSAPDGVDGYSPVIVNVEASGGANIQSGSFTPAGNILEYTIPVNGTVKNFCFTKKTSELTYGVRTYVGLIHLESNDWTIGISTNASGTSGSISTANNGANWISIADGEVKLNGSTDTYPGYLVPEQYNWVAW